VDVTLILSIFKPFTSTSSGASLADDPDTSMLVTIHFIPLPGHPVKSFASPRQWLPRFYG